MSEKLDEIRRQIDDLDKKMLTLLEKRAALASVIGQEKAKSGVNAQILYPDREAALVRRLLDNVQTKTSFPKRSIFRIWREIVGASAIVQNPDIKICFIQDEYRCDPRTVSQMQLIREHFGNAVPLQPASNILLAFNMLREGEADFAVLPYPEDGEVAPWWITMPDETSYHNINIVGRLPFNSHADMYAQPEHKALIIAKLPFSPSSKNLKDDCTFLVISSHEAMSRARVIEKLASKSLETLSVCSYIDSVTKISHHLVEVDQYVPNNEKSAQDIASIFGEEAVSVHNVGGYPTPYIFE